jgi:hypothetical protein
MGLCVPLGKNHPIRRVKNINQDLGFQISFCVLTSDKSWSFSCIKQAIVVVGPQLFLDEALTSELSAYAG